MNYEVSKTKLNTRFNDGIDLHIIFHKLRMWSCMLNYRGYPVANCKNNLVEEGLLSDETGA